MQVTSIRIKNYRSIEDVSLTFPEGKPLVLFGPNNAGKSNISSAIDRLLGDRYPTYIEMLDSDFFMRDKDSYPVSKIEACFSEPLYKDKYDRPITKICVSYSQERSKCELTDGSSKIYPTNENRANFQSFLITAERDVLSAFNYSSKYSMLSRFSHKIHEAITSESKDKLNTAFNQIRQIFEESPKYKSFFEVFSTSLENAVKGFVHSLSVDFSAYDPNNYAKSLRIFAKEGENIRGFEEFGTGEQQVLLMAFVKAYMETFTNEHFMLIIEEPEAHLHPLAQKWLKEHIEGICKSGIQVVITTHSSVFLEPEYLDALVRVYKENGVTKVKQISKEMLADFCCKTGAVKTTENNVVDFYSTKLFKEQLNGLFAEKIILVEGATEYFALPEYLKRIGFSLPQHGIEIVNCNGKGALPLFWRIYNAFNIKCFMIFDRDSKDCKKANEEHFAGLLEKSVDWKFSESYILNEEILCWSKDFETYLKSVLLNYSEIETRLRNDYGINSKPGIARGIARETTIVPPVFKELSLKLK